MSTTAVLFKTQLPIPLPLMAKPVPQTGKASQPRKMMHAGDQDDNQACNLSKTLVQGGYHQGGYSFACSATWVVVTCVVVCTTLSWHEFVAGQVLQHASQFNVTSGPVQMMYVMTSILLCQSIHQQTSVSQLLQLDKHIQCTGCDADVILPCHYALSMCWNCIPVQNNGVMVVKRRLLQFVHTAVADLFSKSFHSYHNSFFATKCEQQFTHDRCPKHYSNSSFRILQQFEQSLIFGVPSEPAMKRPDESFTDQVHRVAKARTPPTAPRAFQSSMAPKAPVKPNMLLGGACGAKVAVKTSMARAVPKPSTAPFLMVKAVPTSAPALAERAPSSNQAANVQPIASSPVRPTVMDFTEEEEEHVPAATRGSDHSSHA